MSKERDEKSTKKYSQLSDEEEAELTDAEALDAFYTEIEEGG